MHCARRKAHSVSLAGDYKHNTKLLSLLHIDLVLHTRQISVANFDMTLLHLHFAAFSSLTGCPLLQ